MEMETLIVTVVLTLLLLGMGLEMLLIHLNIKKVVASPTVPDFVRERVDPETYSRSRSYSIAKLGFNRAVQLAGAVFFVFLLFSGILPWLESFLRPFVAAEVTRGVLFLGLLMMFQIILSLPISAYETFGIESRFGFNTQTPGSYFRDMAKEWVLFFLLGVPFLYAVLSIIDFGGKGWWIGLLVFLIFVQVLLLVIYPTWIAPLFNRFKPLEEGEIKRELMDLAKRLQFPLQDIYVMDGSRRSLHSNAYFTGFGRMRRIVLFDTLLSQMDKSEIAGVLAHEIGHYKLRHIYKNLAASVISMAVMLYLIAFFIDWTPLYLAFGFSEPITYVGLFLLFMVFSTTHIVFAPLRNFFSRKFEYEADRFAVSTTRSAAAMESALVKLSEKNLSNLTPHPWYSFFHHSHPGLSERVKAIRKVAQTT